MYRQRSIPADPVQSSRSIAICAGKNQDSNLSEKVDCFDSDYV